MKWLLPCQITVRVWKRDTRKCTDVVEESDTSRDIDLLLVNTWNDIEGQGARDASFGSLPRDGCRSCFPCHFISDYSCRGDAVVKGLPRTVESSVHHLSEKHLNTLSTFCEIPKRIFILQISGQRPLTSTGVLVHGISMPWYMTPS